jgi:hypothetical protein
MKMTTKDLKNNIVISDCVGENDDVNGKDEGENYLYNGGDTDKNDYNIDDHAGKKIILSNLPPPICCLTRGPEMLKSWGDVNQAESCF